VSHHIIYANHLLGIDAIRAKNAIYFTLAATTGNVVALAIGSLHNPFSNIDRGKALKNAIY
jgi:hypothetical protein